MTATLPLLQIPFYFLRHGETETNRTGLVAGASDVALNATGWRQARAAAELLRQRNIVAIYSSPLQRAHDTAQCVAVALGLPLTVIVELAERNWGVFEGRPRAMRMRDATPPGGEGPEEFAQRTLAGLAKIPAAPLPLIVAHSGTFRVLSRYLGIAQSETPVKNSQPMRFVPPAGARTAWLIESL
jgi:probable phosphoglycerate mutase